MIADDGSDEACTRVQGGGRRDAGLLPQSSRPSTAVAADREGGGATANAGRR